MARKTIAVASIVAKTNGYLANSDDDRQAERLGMIVVLEYILFETDNYKGFSFTVEGDETRRRYVG